MSEDEAAVNQLKGLPIDVILMTHLDSDHVSGLKDFENIPVYASAQEVNASQKERIRYGNLAKGIDFNTFHFTEDSSAPFDKSCNVFGDGSVIAYLTPTHSAGSVIYKISEGDDFALVVGDNGYQGDSWEKRLLPGPLYNADNMKKSLKWINDQNRKQNCVGIFCAHDPVNR